jgi:hypothetical protein
MAPEVNVLGEQPGPQRSFVTDRCQAVELIGSVITSNKVWFGVWYLENNPSLGGLARRSGNFAVCAEIA